MPGKLIVDEIEDSGGSSVIGRKNFIINGNFDLWQRGTSVTGQTSDQYLADRWIFQADGSTYSYQQASFTAGQTDVPNNPKYYANLTVTGANADARIQQPIEDVNTLSGQKATISFWAKHTTNAPTDLRVRIRQTFGSGGSTAVNTALTPDFTTTTSWQKFTYTTTIPSVSGKTIGAGSAVAVQIMNPNNEVWDLQIAQVQVEKGGVATDFEVRPIGEELALCERYFQIFIEGTQEIMTGGYYTGSVILGAIHFPTMRDEPSISVTSGTNYYRFWRNNAGDDFDDFDNISSIGKKTARLQNNTGMSGTAGHAGTVVGYNANSKITLDAEL